MWRQGFAALVAQAVPDESKGEPSVVAELRLPAHFEICTPCCGGQFFVTARCKAPDGVWSSTELETAASARRRPHERRGDFKLRLKWLEGRAV